MKTKLLSLLLCAALAVTLLASCSDKTETTGEEKIADLKYTDYITLPAYTGVSATDPGSEVKDEDVQSQIDLAVGSHPVVTDVTDRGAETGDTLTVDYVGMMDGVAFQGGTDTDAEITIGAGGLIPGFEDGLIGAKAGDELTLDLTFPDPYENNPDFAGKPAQFIVTVKAVQVYAPNEFTDEFVATYYPEFSGTADYEASIRESLAESAAESRKTNIITQIWQSVIEGTTVIKYPETIVAQELAEAIEYYTDFVATNFESMELSAFLETYQNSTLDEFKASLESDIRSSLVEEMILRQIIKNEGLTLTDEEYTAGAQEYADYYSITIEELETQYGAEVVRDNLLWDKVFEFLLEKAELTTGETA